MNRRHSPVMMLIATVLAITDLPATDTKREGSEKTSPPKAFEKLVSEDGTEYFDCKVVRVEPDALILHHRKGVARLSFFDLPRETREAFDFDPFAAIEHYRKENERQRQLRWQNFWEKQRYEAELAEKEANKKVIEEALSEWIPVEAKVTQSGNGRSRTRALGVGG